MCDFAYSLCLELTCMQKVFSNVTSLIDINISLAENDSLKLVLQRNKNKILLSGSKYYQKSREGTLEILGSTQISKHEYSCETTLEILVSTQISKHRCLYEITLKILVSTQISKHRCSCEVTLKILVSTQISKHGY